MKKCVILLLILFFSTNICLADVFVNGYSRQDGTYVNGYYRSSPNSTRMDNFSTKGNYNPYTGSPGTKDPYANYGSTYNNNNNYNSNYTQKRNTTYGF